MPAKKVSSKAPTLALPARMRIVPEQLGQLQIAVLDFPFEQALSRFIGRLKPFLQDGKLELEKYPSYRLLNNTILTCTSTIVYAFEYFGAGRQMLAVGQPEYDHQRNIIGTKFQYPSVEALTEVIEIWLKEWGEQPWLNQLIEGDAKDAWADLQTALKQPETDWRKITAQELLADLDQENALGYRAIPSLLTALLHQKTSWVGEREVTWRKALGGKDGRPGLFLLSRPFRAKYDKIVGKDKEAKEKTGYFAYRVDFSVQTQAGRFGANGKLQPWLFIQLSCQRYASGPLKKANAGRNVSVMMALNKERLDTLQVDSALARLEINWDRENKKWRWLNGLPELLGKFALTKLTDPTEILANPASYANLANTTDWNKDEYYLVHAEGYVYGHRAKHTIMTGFSFKEQHEIVGELLKYFQGILEPDAPFETDRPAPKGATAPAVLKHFSKDVAQSIVEQALMRSFGEHPALVLVIYEHNPERELLERKLREALGIGPAEQVPTQIQIKFVQIPASQSALRRALGEQPASQEGQEKQKLSSADLAGLHRAKKEEWRAFLQTHADKNFQAKFALIALPEWDDNDDDKLKTSVKGAIREACALEGIGSQIVRGIKKTKGARPSKFSKKVSEAEDYKGGMIGKAKNGVRDLVVRQAALLGGPPAEAYRAAGLPAELADQLDLLGFCRYVDQKLNLHYVLATRLSADGKLEVLFPEPGSRWLPYQQAGPELGRIVSQARSVHKQHKDSKKKKVASPLDLDNAQLAQFLVRVLTSNFTRPTLALIEAEGWRNGRGSDRQKWVWPQLKNEQMLEKRQLLDFSHVPGHEYAYRRDDQELNQLLGVIRIRTGAETPQYVASAQDWDTNLDISRDFPQLTGFIDRSVPNLLHYFSVGRLPDTQRKSQTPSTWNVYKSKEDGAQLAIKHQQFIELVPFFLREDCQTAEVSQALCRAAHYLRLSPAWDLGNTVLPYPIHLGEQLIEDQTCILDQL